MQRSDIAGRRDLASLSEAATYAGVTTRTVRNWISRGVLPAYRIGTRTVRVDIGELDAALRPIPAGSTDVA